MHCTTYINQDRIFKFEECESPINHNIRRQINFKTPDRISCDVKSLNLQQMRKPKLSKSKIMNKLNKNKLIIDFKIAKDFEDVSFFSMNENMDEKDQSEVMNLSLDYDALQKTHILIDLSNKSKAEDGIDSSFDQCLYETPVIRKDNPKCLYSTPNLEGYISGAKISRKNPTKENSFFRLLNESDKYSIDKYQILTGPGRNQNDNETLNEKTKPFSSIICKSLGDLTSHTINFYQLKNECDIMDKFFMLFEAKSSEIITLFAKNAVFEIIEENKPQALDITLNVLSKYFSKFEPENISFEYQHICTDKENEVILKTSGKLIVAFSDESKLNFTLISKLTKNIGNSSNDHYWVITHLKLKIF